MKGWDWFITLNKDNQRCWMDNMLNHIQYKDFDHIIFILNREYGNLRDFLLNSFIWDDTPEDCEYWDRIENNNKEYKLKFEFV